MTERDTAVRDSTVSGTGDDMGARDTGRNGRTAGVRRRITALARAELLLLLRNRLALGTALLLPIGSLFLFAPILEDLDIGMAARAYSLTGLAGFLLLYVVYYNLATAYVARREELVLKRLRTGECTDAEILAGTAVPAVAGALIQMAVAVPVGALLLDLPVPVNAPLMLLGMLGGLVVFWLLAAASSVFTRSTELAQLTTMPLVLICLFASGVVFPATQWPDPVPEIARFLPLTPVMELMRLGWVGTTGERAPVDFVGTLRPAGLPLAVLVAWIGVGVWTVRRFFRWEPRR
ncbi:transport permease protein [Virgisporangium aliadipatigenens]|uniref:Transport permease protein n=1 Tax=Virgisporangium aliadipatigenens TaxID=741659 RepID=A0A8J4DNC4_9ACTN|nr:ABC transporter permease [Virgisporangium aliadipatigenens]GIJ44259.1 transport permease protein [Virgisporangium aliadipatigenens]